MRRLYGSTVSGGTQGLREASHWAAALPQVVTQCTFQEFPWSSEIRFLLASLHHEPRHRLPSLQDDRIGDRRRVRPRPCHRGPPCAQRRQCSHRRPPLQVRDSLEATSSSVSSSCAHAVVCSPTLVSLALRVSSLPHPSGLVSTARTLCSCCARVCVCVCVCILSFCCVRCGEPKSRHRGRSTAVSTRWRREARTATMSGSLTLTCMATGQPPKLMVPWRPLQCLAPNAPYSFVPGSLNNARCASLDALRSVPSLPHSLLRALAHRYNPLGPSSLASLALSPPPQRWHRGGRGNG